MSLYRVHFKWNDKDLTLKARQLDLTHPYFVSIKDIILPESNKIIIDPSEDEVRKTFGRAEHLMIPFQTVSLIEEFSKDPDEEEELVKRFSIIDENQNKSDREGGGAEDSQEGSGND